MNDTPNKNAFMVAFEAFEAMEAENALLKGEIANLEHRADEAEHERDAANERAAKAEARVAAVISALGLADQPAPIAEPAPAEAPKPRRRSNRQPTANEESCGLDKLDRNFEPIVAPEPAPAPAEVPDYVKDGTFPYARVMLGDSRLIEAHYPESNEHEDRSDQVIAWTRDEEDPPFFDEKGEDEDNWHHFEDVSYSINDEEPLIVEALKRSRDQLGGDILKFTPYEAAVILAIHDDEWMTLARINRSARYNRLPSAAIADVREIMALFPGMIEERKGHPAWRLATSKVEPAPAPAPAGLGDLAAAIERVTGKSASFAAQPTPKPKAVAAEAPAEPAPAPAPASRFASPFPEYGIPPMLDENDNAIFRALVRAAKYAPGEFQKVATLYALAQVEGYTLTEAALRFRMKLSPNALAKTHAHLIEEQASPLAWRLRDPKPDGGDKIEADDADDKAPVAPEPAPDAERQTFKLHGRFSNPRARRARDRLLLEALGDEGKTFKDWWAEIERRGGDMGPNPSQFIEAAQQRLKGEYISRNHFGGGATFYAYPSLKEALAKLEAAK